MIIARLNGGLGNQLFQYATGRAMAIRHQQPLIIDHRVFLNDKFRQFCLPHFKADYVLSSDVPSIEAKLPPSRKEWLHFLAWRFTHGRRLRFIREKSLVFDPGILKLKPDVYLYGYWQCEEYFSDVSSLIRAELTVRTSPSEQNQMLLNEIGDNVSVSVHIRRGDYVTDPKASRVHGLCSLQYYQDAAKHLADKLSESPFFYVFSDDPQWVRENLRLPFETRFVDHNDDASNYEDLRLMSSCRHHIVANSSFSWWGAWLGVNPGKLVIAPRIWFNDASRSDLSLVPRSWTRL